MSEPEFGAGPDVTWDKEEEIGTYFFNTQPQFFYQAFLNIY